MAWSVEGTYIEACNCEAACPCIFFSPPTEGECKLVVGWHVDKGRHGETSPDGLNAALIVVSRGGLVRWSSLWTRSPRSIRRICRSATAMIARC